MTDGITRRDLVAAGGALGLATAARGANRANPAGLDLLVATDGLTIPSTGRAEMAFSYDWPEPSVAFAGFRFAFEVIGYDNRYALDPATATLTATPDRVRLTAHGLTWAGGQEKIPGTIAAELVRLPDGAVEWTMRAALDRPIKALKTIVRGLPRGRVSPAARAWIEPGEDDQRFEYPALNGGMATPLVAIEAADGRVWTIASRQREVRPARFQLRPGPAGYKAELVAETPGWTRPTSAATQPWRIAAAPDFASAARDHFAHVADAWSLPSFRTRPDAPDWMKHLALVLTLHGQHWSGRILNDYDRQRAILRWAAERIDPATVMIFLAGWDGRYYWDYPAFAPDPRMGGAAGFARLIAEGRRLGYRFALMFGSNVANPTSPLFPPLAEAQLRDPYGQNFPANYVDWDGDAKGDSGMVFMNLAAPAWRTHLAGRIADMLGRHPIDAYFLDIAGLWENNDRGDMFEGTRALVADLARRLPGRPPIAEMQYDAQMGVMPMSQVARYPLYPQANFDHVASFDHLSHGAPGRGATGVHEAGFNRYRPVTADQRPIPTITFADRTFDDDLAAVQRDIATAKARFAARGNWT
ncbi:hypothetical protein [Sphingomonas nostoxanthinifaciens]|uniref:hypothetical protein n=1 Tax=Sphingomonas nostoxanthinifaciens TaxID=2872652 RepID=UPI001CC21A8B|nr:hypothetical protein [Sphingomonas nostoxanthinifaciens]UAK24766.1 hypothetical protein K8P63_00640 [Sphingomonas nostoxanthinifaciens]